MTDLMGYARNGSDGKILIAVEGKADEPLALPVRAQVRRSCMVPLPRSCGLAQAKDRYEGVI